MTNITLYDYEAERIRKLAKKYDCCEASVVEAIFEILEDNEIDIEKEW